jgi:hypothetical protein
VVNYGYTEISFLSSRGFRPFQDEAATEVGVNLKQGTTRPYFPTAVLRGTVKIDPAYENSAK